MIAVVGATGQLGTAFRALLAGAAWLTRDELDLARPQTIESALADLKPSAIINCAAYTAVDRAEEEEDLAQVINGVAVGELARYAAAAGIPLVTFSTDYVFDGSAAEPYVESSPTAPINAYGRTKYAGERMALELHSGSLVIRTSWVVSATHPNFVATMLRLARENREWQVVADQIGCPTIAADLAVATLEALNRGVTGILHMTNQGETSWYDLAQEAVRLAGGDPHNVTPCTTADYPTPARRPAYSVLGSERTASLDLAPLRDWREALRSVVAGQVAAATHSP